MHEEPLKKLIVRCLFLWIFAASASLPARAANLKFSFQTGTFSGDYAGADAGEISMPNAFDIQAEYTTSSRSSLSVRSMASLDSTSGIFRYLYAGFGRRYYWKSYSGSQYYEYDSTRIEVNPKMQYYISGEGGLSQMVVRQITTSFSVQSTLIELGLSAGAVYSLSKDFGATASFSYVKGVGISAVAVDSTIIKLLFGIQFQ